MEPVQYKEYKLFNSIAEYFSNPSLKDEVSVKVMELKQKAAG